MYRRLRGDLIEAYKYTHKSYDTKSLFELQGDDRTRENDFKIKNKDAEEMFERDFSV